MLQATRPRPALDSRVPAGAGRTRALAALALATLPLSCRFAAEPAPSTTEPPLIRVLGTAQDGGLPHAACDCRRCRAARQDPARRRNVASLAVCPSADGRCWLIDATPDIREQLEMLAGEPVGAAGGVDRDPLLGVLLTHAHMGHYLGLAFFGYEAVHTRELPVICTPRMAEYLERNGPWSQLVRLGNVLLRPVAPGGSVELGAGVRARLVAVPHRDEYSDTVGFLLEGPRRRVLYVPDTDGWEAWSPELLQLAREVDLLLIDGTFFSAGELPGRELSEIGHPLISRTLELFAEPVRSGRLSVLFTHFNHSNPALEPAGEARAAIERSGFGVLEDGETLPL